MDIYLSKTQGLCAGVTRAIGVVDKALELYGAPLYVYHEIVHNNHVVDEFRKKGVIFVEDVEEIPAGERVIFSAHGIPPSVMEKAEARHLKCVDATCPLVTKVHNEATRFSKKGLQTILIGHRGHQELIGTSGYVEPDLLHVVENEDDIDALDIDPDTEVAYITQTTLSVDDTAAMIKKLEARFPNLKAPPKSDLCYATQNRQNAVKELAEFCDVIIICGSPNSSNSNRLRETGEKVGVDSYIVDTAVELDITVLEGKTKVGISSGASVPRVMVDELVHKIQSRYPEAVVNTFEDPEKKVVFPLPKIENALV